MLLGSSMSHYCAVQKGREKVVHLNTINHFKIFYENFDFENFDFEILGDQAGENFFEKDLSVIISGIKYY